jgi:hypothetical protein
MRELQYNNSKSDNNNLKSKLSENDKLNQYLKVKQELDKALETI